MYTNKGQTSSTVNEHNVVLLQSVTQRRNVVLLQSVTQRDSIGSVHKMNFFIINQQPSRIVSVIPLSYTLIIAQIMLRFEHFLRSNQSN